MNDLIDAISSRIKSPYFGYAILAFFALNWRGVFLLLMTPGSPQERLSAFDAVTSQYTLLILPLFAGVLVALATPWVHWFFAVVSIKPSSLVDNLNLEAEHRKTIRQAELEQSRSNLFAVKENELIERAKRDEEVAGIEDNAAKEKLISELEKLRQERDSLSIQLKNQAQIGTPQVYSISTEASEIIKAASKSGQGTIVMTQAIGARGFQVGSTRFGFGGAREFVKYQSAVDELVSKGLAKAVGTRENRFELTNAGWELAETLLR